jgi:hypothetical protein
MILYSIIFEQFHEINEGNHTLVSKINLKPEKKNDDKNYSSA